MAASVALSCLCTLFLFTISGSWAFPYSRSDDVIEFQNIISNTESQILRNIEAQLHSIERKLEVFEDLKSLSENQPDVPADQSDIFSSRANPEVPFAGRTRRGSWDNFDLDTLKETPREQLLDLLNLYSNMHNQRNTGSSSSYRSVKRQPPAGFHAVRGKRPSAELLPSFASADDLDFPVTRRDPLFRGFSASRGKK